jgi:hypothetical protein
MFPAASSKTDAEAQELTMNKAGKADRSNELKYVILIVQKEAVKSGGLFAWANKI